MRLSFTGWDLRRWARTILVTVIIIVTLAVLYRVRDALTPFVLGLFLAYLVLPAIDWLQAHLPHGQDGRKIERYILDCLQAARHSMKGRFRHQKVGEGG